MTSERAFSGAFLCTAHSARSIAAGSVFNRIAHGRIRAGSHPASERNRFVRRLPQKRLFPADELRKLHRDALFRPDAPPLDFELAVCDRAAGAIRPGKPLTAHWQSVDFAAVDGHDDARLAAMPRTFPRLHRRISPFTSRPPAKLNAVHGRSFDSLLNPSSISNHDC